MTSIAGAFIAIVPGLSIRNASLFTDVGVAVKRKK
jgi:hypothetical protein